MGIKVLVEIYIYSNTIGHHKLAHHVKLRNDILKLNLVLRNYSNVLFKRLTSINMLCRIVLF